MKPTEILVNEHRIIKQMLSVLESMSNKADTEGKLDIESAKSAIEFFRNFSDKCHHAKEEDRLFPKIESRGIPRQGGPVGVMLMEHNQGRDNVRAMSESVDAANGDGDTMKKFIGNARSFVSMLRAHIDKEDECLYPMANDALTDTDQAELKESFEKFDRDGMGHEAHEKYIRTADELAEKFGVSRAATQAELA